MIIKSHDSVNKSFMSASALRSKVSGAGAKNNTGTNETIQRGTPAIYLTFGDVMLKML